MPHLGVTRCCMFNTCRDMSVVLQGHEIHGSKQRRKPSTIIRERDACSGNLLRPPKLTALPDSRSASPDSAISDPGTLCPTRCPHWDSVCFSQGEDQAHLQSAAAYRDFLLAQAPQEDTHAKNSLESAGETASQAASQLYQRCDNLLTQHRCLAEAFCGLSLSHVPCMEVPLSINVPDYQTSMRL